ncbi:MAG: tyrosine recombinase XerD [candidate division Zixibacteria bacterium]|nr:tyrosine recombinase XerD [candidate division Zixibacteria bacterium]
MDFRTAIEDFLQSLKLERGLSANSISAYRSDLNELAISLAIEAPTSAKAADLNKYFNYLAGLGRKPATLARKLSAAKRFFEYLIERGAIKQNPAAGYRAPKIARYHPDYLSVQEIERILAAADLDPKLALRDRAMIELLYGCGLRISELLDLKIGCLEFEAGFVKVTGKGNKQRLVPLGKFADEAVKKFLDSPERAGFPGDSSRYLLVNGRGKRLSRVGLWKAIKRLVIRAGITKTVTPHTFRHSFATHLLAGGADLRAVQEMLGHADISTTEIYTQVDQGYIVAEHRRHHPRELAGFRRQ